MGGVNRNRAVVLMVAAIFAAAVVASAYDRTGGRRSEGREPRAPPTLQPSYSTVGGVDPRAPFLRRFDGTVYGGLSLDSIPAVYKPEFDSVDDAGELLGPDALVISLTVNGETHGYPVNLLAAHEVVNDVVGGVPVVVTYCPLCHTALAYERRVGGKTLVFGVSGKLYRANLLLYDRGTRSLWSQLLGGAVTGPYRGARFRPVPATTTTWAAFRQEHPGAAVLSIRKDALAANFTHPRLLPTNYGLERTDAPYQEYAVKASRFPYRGRSIFRGLPSGELVLGLEVAGTPRAYPLSLLFHRRVVEDTVGTVPLLVVEDEAHARTVAFLRTLGGRPLHFRTVRVHGRLALAERRTGTRFSLATGEARRGPLAGGRLQQIPATLVYWWAWLGFFPETQPYREPTLR